MCNVSKNETGSMFDFVVGAICVAISLCILLSLIISSISNNDKRIFSYELIYPNGKIQSIDVESVSEPTITYHVGMFYDSYVEISYMPTSIQYKLLKFPEGTVIEAIE